MIKQKSKLTLHIWTPHCWWRLAENKAKLTQSPNYLILPPFLQDCENWPSRKCLEPRQQQLWAAERKPNDGNENTGTPTDILQSSADHKLHIQSFCYRAKRWTLIQTSSTAQLKYISAVHYGRFNNCSVKHRQSFFGQPVFLFVRFAWKTKTD